MKTPRDLFNPPPQAGEIRDQKTGKNVPEPHCWDYRWPTTTWWYRNTSVMTGGK